MSIFSFLKPHVEAKQQSTEKKGYHADPINSQNEYFRQLYAFVQQSMQLQDMGDVQMRDYFYKLITDPQKANHTASSVIQSITATAAELMPYVELQDKDGKVIEKHWSVDLLTQPNDAQTTEELISAMMLNYLTQGEVFVYGNEPMIKTKGQKFTNVYVMPSHLVNIVSGGITAPIAGYTLRNGFQSLYSGAVPKLNPSNTMHAKMPNLSVDTWHGLSRLTAVYTECVIMEAAIKRNGSIIKNGGAVTIITPQGDPQGIEVMAPKEKKDFIDSVKRADTESYKESRFLDFPAVFNSIGDTPEDMGIMPILEKCEQAVANQFNYPIDLLYGRSTYSNMGEAMKMRYIITIPFLQAILTKWARFTDCTAEGLRWVINTDKIEVLKPSSIEQVGAMRAAGCSINETREYMGYTPDPSPQSSMPMYQVGFAFMGEDAEPIDENKPIK